MPKQKINLLDKWKDRAWYFSTGHYEDRILKEKIGFIYDRLKTAFGERYFSVWEGEERPLDKVSWIYSLLAIKDYAAGIGALLEIAELIDYLRGLNDVVQTEFKNLRPDAIGLRSFFSELYIFRLLDSGGVTNKKKIWDGDQKLEGTCELGGKDFLFECRKLYAPNLHEVDIKWRLVRDLAQVKLKHGHGMICTVNFEKPLIGRHRNNFADKIRTYFEGFNKLTGRPEIRYEHKDEFGVFKAINYSAQALQDTTLNSGFEILYYLEETGKIADNGLSAFEGKIKTNFHFSKEAVYRKLKTVLKEKKDQHKDSAFKNKIIFLDSESISELYFGLFADERTYDINEVMRVYNALDLDCILCIIRRDYRGPTPIVLTDIIRPASLADEAAELGRIFPHDIP